MLNKINPLSTFYTVKKIPVSNQASFLPHSSNSNDTALLSHQSDSAVTPKTSISLDTARVYSNATQNISSLSANTNENANPTSDDNCACSHHNSIQSQIKTLESRLAQQATDISELRNNQNYPKTYVCI